MKTLFRPRIVVALVALMMLAGAGLEWRNRIPHAEGSDFSVYYTAACLVRSNMSLQIYDEAARDINSQVVFADPNTVFARTAGAHGIPRVHLYVYPPTLADLLVPLTAFPHTAALIVWELLSLTMLLYACVMLTHMLGMRLPGQFGLFAVLIVMFRPTLNCFHYGQVSILLLLLVIAGSSLYAHRQKNMAGLAFALAVAIKLTPLIVIVPFLAWRDWKILRAITLWGAAILGALWIVNGRGTLSLYCLHILPSMATVNVHADRTLSSMLYGYWRGLDNGTSPIGLVWAVRLTSALVLCYAGWLSRLNREDNLQDSRRFETVSIFLLLSCCLAPVSWLHAYVLSTPALVALGKRIWERRSNPAETTLLILFVLSLSTTKFAHLAMAAPLLGVLLGIMELHRLQHEQFPERVSTVVC
jgi:hypothetical protein